MHTIHDIAFEINVQTNQLTNSWEQLCVDFVKNQLLPRLERMLNDWQLKHLNTKCTIESLDIEVEVDGLDLEATQRKIMQQCQQQLQEIQSDGRNMNGKKVAVFTRETSPFEAFVQYLSSGFLPKPFTVKSVKDWLSSQDDFSSEEKQTLAQLFSKDRTSVARILSLFRNVHAKLFSVIETSQQINTHYIQFEEDFFQTYVETFSKANDIAHTVAQAQIWFQTLKSCSSLSQFSQLFIQLLTSKLASEGKKIVQENKQELILSLIQAIVQYEQHKSIQMATLQHGITIAKKTSSKEDSAFTSSTREKSAEKNTTKSTENKANSEENTPQTDKKKSIHQPENTKEITKQPSEVSNEPEVSSKAAQKASKFTENAKKTVSNKKLIDQDVTEFLLKNSSLTTEKSGLVLLHPFLATFLKGAEVISEENTLVHPEKACALLHYLATENEEVSDIELTLEKILLGIPLSNVMHYQESLTEKDKQMCVELLEAVLEHWVVLKKSTINTLRDMFLKRDGELQLNEDGIQLKIEKAAQDILLDKIPWNISLFRLKWMEKIMYIEW